MSESFENAMDYANAMADYGDIPLLDRLQIAHDHEIEQMRKEMAVTYELTHCPSCETRLKTLDVQHEIELADKAAYHRGYVAGQRSMDADHVAVAMRLRGLRFDGGSHENLGKIAYAIYPCATGWTVESCEGLRDWLIDLLGGVHDGISDCVCGGACADGCRDGHGQQEAVDVDDSVSDVRADVPAADGVADSAAAQVMYDVLDNERHKAVCRLREWRPDEDGRPYREFWEAVMGEKLPTVPLKGDAELDILMRDRLIHLLGGDEPTESFGSFLEALVKKTEELSRQGKVKFPPNEDGSLDSLKTVEEAAALIDDAKRRADQSHESSPMRQENETGIADELRELIAKYDIPEDENHMWLVTSHDQRLIVAEAYAIADRIEEQFKRLCEQQEAVLQKTINDLIDERNKLQRELSEQKSCAEGFAQTAQAKWYEEQVLKLERELVEVRGAVDRARDGWAKTDEEKRELQEERDELRRNAEHEADKCKECREMFGHYRDAYVKYVGKYNNAVKQHDELQAKLEEADAAIANYREREKSFVESERQRDELQAKLDAIREAMDG